MEIDGIKQSCSTWFIFSICKPSIKTKKVEFESKGQKLVGTLYVPESSKKNAKFPAVVVTGAWTTVKEQMPKNYAKELVKKGLVVLTFDFRGWGESKGEQKYLEDPERKTQDILSAIDYLANRPEVDVGKINGLGICASSGYMVEAYTRTDKLQSVALIAPWLHNKKIATQVYGGDQAVKKLLDSAKVAEQKFKKTAQPTVAVAASVTDKNSIMYQAPYYTETDRGLIQEYDNKFNVASWKGWLNYNALESAKDLKGKILLVSSEAMALPQGAKEYEKMAKGKVKQVWLDDVTQFDFYDKKEIVSKATDLAFNHFTKKK
ncbi:MAG: alpha/beta hydrolase [Bdellovibrionales bacterium]|nr:alpha/beta hydrolase [Bdellovibrionales bacterium]